MSIKAWLFILLYGIQQFVLAEQSCIRNFNQSLCGDFIIADNIIIKSPLSKAALEKKINKPLQQIGFLRTQHLYLMASNNAINEARHLSEKPYITYAQPDIIQPRQYSNLLFDLKTGTLHFSDTKKFGEGVNVAIIDDGFNLDHEDLQGVEALFTYDADERDLDASNKLEANQHGTLVAGLIFAQHNGIGINGIAPKASLIAIRQPQNRTSSTVLSFTVADKANADIINCSWNSPVLMEPVFDVISDLAKYGRAGKGTAVVFAAGNQGKELMPLSVEAAIPDVITVGTQGSYSNYGALVDIIAPTGMKSTQVTGGYGNFGGTSAAASWVSGMLAELLSQDNTQSIVQLYENLKDQLSEH